MKIELNFCVSTQNWGEPFFEYWPEFLEKSFWNSNDGRAKVSKTAGKPHCGQKVRITYVILFNFNCSPHFVLIAFQFLDINQWFFGAGCYFSDWHQCKIILLRRINKCSFCEWINILLSFVSSVCLYFFFEVPNPFCFYFTYPSFIYNAQQSMCVVYWTFIDIIGLYTVIRFASTYNTFVPQVHFDVSA